MYSEFRDPFIEAGVDARGVGLQAQIAASVIHEQPRVGEATDAVCGQGRAAAINR